LNLKLENESLKKDVQKNENLEEEIQFIKRHYDIEINLLKD